MRIRKLMTVGLLVLLVGLADGCIAIVERGTRNGKVTQFANEVIRKGDKKAEVKSRLGEPDDVSPVDSAGVEYMTYHSMKGMYIVVFGQFEYTTVRVKLINGVVDEVYAEQSGKDLLILTGYSGGTAEPTANPR